MTDEHRADQPEAISPDDAERLLAGVAPGPHDPPSLASLHEILTATRRAGENHELADAATVLAAFRAARSPIRASRRHVAPLNSITRRTIAIIGIATGASLGAAFATGAVDNPFDAPPPVDRGPVMTRHPVEPLMPSATIARDPNSVATTSNVAPVIGTPVDTDPASSGTATTPPQDADQIGRESGADPSATAPGQTGDSPSATAPGRTGESPSATPPGQTGDSPSATAPGRTGDSPSATAPGQTGDSPSATAPGQTRKHDDP